MHGDKRQPSHIGPNVFHLQRSSILVVVMRVLLC